MRLRGSLRCTKCHDLFRARILATKKHKRPTVEQNDFRSAGGIDRDSRDSLRHCRAVVEGGFRVCGLCDLYHCDRREFRLFVIQFSRGRRVPLAQMSLCPAEALVQMALVAGIRPAGLHGAGHRRTGDLMAAHRLQQAIRRVRHVAVVAAAAG